MLSNLIKKDQDYFRKRQSHRDKRGYPDSRRKGDFWGLENTLGGTSNSNVSGPGKFGDLNPKNQSFRSFMEGLRSQKSMRSAAELPAF